MNRQNYCRANGRMREVEDMMFSMVRSCGINNPLCGPLCTSSMRTCGMLAFEFMRLLVAGVPIMSKQTDNRRSVKT